MITHWQIEAALREEARTGQSLVTTDPNVSRAFLPFSEPALNMILVGLQPRENIILRAKQYAENFWMAMLLFRAVHFNELELPFPYSDPDPVTGRRRPIVHAYLHVSPPSQSYQSLASMIVELNLIAAMARPDMGASVAKQGDVWECEIDEVDCFRRMVFLAPRRLVERVED